MIKYRLLFCETGAAVAFNDLRYFVKQFNNAIRKTTYKKSITLVQEIIYHAYGTTFCD